MRGFTKCRASLRNGAGPYCLVRRGFDMSLHDPSHVASCPGGWMVRKGWGSPSQVKIRGGQGGNVEGRGGLRGDFTKGGSTVRFLFTPTGAIPGPSLPPLPPLFPSVPEARSGMTPVIRDMDASYSRFRRLWDGKGGNCPMAEVVEMEVEGAVPETNTRESNRAISAMTSPWIEKYRPESLSDIIAHQDIMSTCELLLPACHIHSCGLHAAGDHPTGQSRRTLGAPLIIGLLRSESLRGQQQAPPLAALRSPRHGQDIVHPRDGQADLRAKVQSEECTPQMPHYGSEHLNHRPTRGKRKFSRSCKKKGPSNLGGMVCRQRSFGPTLPPHLSAEHDAGTQRIG